MSSTTCDVALNRRRYNERHDNVLTSLHSFASCHLKPGQQMTVDLPDLDYHFPQNVALTDSRPDMVIWCKDSITLIELTIPFEEGTDAAATRKKERYRELLAQCSTTRRTAQLTTIEVGSRGFLNATSFDAFYKHLSFTNKRQRKELETEVVKKCILSSYDIWCKRNWTAKF